MTKASERAEAQSPETPPRRLFVLANDYPDEVLGNPLLPLLAVEDPELFQRIVFRARTVQLEAKIWDRRSRLSNQETWRVLGVLLAGAEPHMIDPQAARCVGLAAELARTAIGEWAHDKKTFFGVLDPVTSLRHKQGLRWQDAHVLNAIIALCEDIRNHGLVGNLSTALDSLQLAMLYRLKAGGMEHDEARLVALGAILEAFGGKP